jgi:hypothetical protein
VLQPGASIVAGLRLDLQIKSDIPNVQFTTGYSCSPLFNIAN